MKLSYLLLRNMGKFGYQIHALVNPLEFASLEEHRAFGADNEIAGRL